MITKTVIYESSTCQTRYAGPESEDEALRKRAEACEALGEPAYKYKVGEIIERNDGVLDLVILRRFCVCKDGQHLPSYNVRVTDDGDSFTDPYSITKQVSEDTISRWQTSKTRDHTLGLV